MATLFGTTFALFSLSLTISHPHFLFAVAITRKGDHLISRTIYKRPNTFSSSVTLLHKLPKVLESDIKLSSTSPPPFSSPAAATSALCPSSFPTKMNRVSTLIVFSIVLCSVLWPQCEGEKGKRNLFIIGGNDGCGPAVVYKTSGGKKGKEGSQIIIVNSGNCGGGGGGGGGLQFMPYPMYMGRRRR